MKRLIPLAALVVAAATLALPARAATTIQPGDYMGSSIGGCTLSFVYDSPSGAVYMGTAAHCVDKVGEDIELEDGRVFGDVALIGNADNTETDWALIGVRDAFKSSVRAAVRGHPSYPKGYTRSNETAFADEVQFSGHGIPWFFTATTREKRTGLMGNDDAESYILTGSDTWGDSGGPIVHVRTGKAMGIVSRLCVGLCTSEGPTVEGIIAKAAAKGLTVSIRTV